MTMSSYVAVRLPPAHMLMMQEVGMRHGARNASEAVRACIEVAAGAKQATDSKGKGKATPRRQAQAQR